VTEILLDVVGVAALAFVALLLLGLVRGRVKARSCCTLPADRDLRLAGARDEPPAS
jgi:hypothetical protein